MAKFDTRPWRYLFLLMSMLFFMFSTAEAEDSGLQIHEHCGSLPKGNEVSSGRFHKELVEGEIALYEAPTGSLNLQRRFVIIKGTDCWLEYFVFSGDEKAKKSTASILDVYKVQFVKPTPKVDVGLASYLYIRDMIAALSVKAKGCLDAQRGAAKRMEKLGSGATSSQISSYLAVEAETDECILEEAKTLSKRGFMGVWAHESGGYRLFAWIDGELHIFSEWR